MSGMLQIGDQFDRFQIRAHLAQGGMADIYRAYDLMNHASPPFSIQVRVDNKPYRISASEVMIANCKLMGLQPQIEGVEIVTVSVS